MSIEEEINQKKFESEQHKAAINILFTSSWLYNLNNGRLKQHGITAEQYNVLRILRGSHPKKLMLADISGRMLDKNSNATRLVEKLRQKGCVKREICAANRRQVDISITPKGLELLKKIDENAESWTSIYSHINRQEAQQLNALLDKLRG